MNEYVTVSVNIGDNDNKDYHRLVYVQINVLDYLVIADGLSVCSGEMYDNSWDALIQRIERIPDLPSRWYVYGKVCLE
jgi:hypothetical protein